MDKKETNIDLGLDMNTGIENKVSADISQEEKNIAEKNGRDVDNKDINDEMSMAIANFRILSGGR